jgi:starch synthase
MVSAEAVPYVKTGGLADVIGSLPQALGHFGCDVRIVLPLYQAIAGLGLETQTIGTVTVPVGSDGHIATIRRVVHPVQPGTDTAALPVAYLVDAPQYFDRSRLYGYDDDIVRFGFFSRACLAMLPLLERVDGWQPDIVHCHDWHAGLFPAYLCTRGNGMVRPGGLRTAFTIHNLAYQGVAAKEYLPQLDLDWSLFNHHQLEFYGQLNPLKAGLVFSDAITTVSPTYAHEIQSPEYGAGLHGVLTEHAHILHGIINGIDYAQWNPQNDPYLAAHYDRNDFAGKRKCKRDLLDYVGLSRDDRAPVIGIVSRLSTQKGLDLVAAALESLVAPPPGGLGCRLIVLGAGDEYYMNLLGSLSKRFPQNTAFRLGQRDEQLAHKIYAGSDLFLMPSNYEPCGLSQMISLAYGTIPVVRATGGLADTVHEYDPTSGHGNGFVFRRYNSQAMLDAVRRALSCYYADCWPKLVRQAMECDFSWDVSAQQYLHLYQHMLHGRRPEMATTVASRAK